MIEDDKLGLNNVPQPIWVTSVFNVKTIIHVVRPDFLLVDLREFFSDLGSGGTKKINKKALKMTS